jgi:CheY-like chemotaxis protein
VSYTLLLADDSVTIQRVIELTFADEDVEVVAVSDGDQAIQRLDTAPPDIVLADVGMPGRDGYEVARHIKHSPKLAHIPVVLLTGAFEPIDQTRAAAAGCDGILAKPFEPQLVIARVKELLAQSRGPRPSGLVQSATPPPAGPRNPQLDEYFDRLDAAFTNLSARSGAPADLPLSEQPPTSRFEQDDAVDDMAGPDSAPTPDVELAPTVVTPAPGAAAPPPTRPPPEPQPAAPEPAASAEPQPAPIPATLPSVADAFAALLAAEQGQATPAARPAWPAGPSSSIEIPDEVVERIVQRVLERMSERVVRDTVAGIVATVAERLVREEIEKLKSAIDDRP